MNMNLQYFAEQAEPAPETGAPEGTEAKSDNVEETSTEEKKFTQDQVNDMIQKRLDRALKDKQKEIDDAKSEAVKYAKMNKDEKLQHDYEKAQADAKKAREDLARYQLRDEARQQLSAGGYQATDADIDMIVTGDAESTKNNTEAFLAMVERIRNATRDEFLKGKSPQVNGQTVKTPSENEFLKMSYQERVDLKNKDPETYNKLANQSY